MDQLSRGMRDLAESIETVARAAERGQRKRGVNVNVQRRVNAKVVVNTGEPGSVTKATAKQDAPIRQRSGRDDA